MKKKKPTKPILSLPIDAQIDERLKQIAHDEHLSRADIVRRILRIHLGFVRGSFVVTQ